jgi:hypothetical protein
MSTSSNLVVPPIGERVTVKLVRGEKEVYDSAKEDKPAFVADTQLLKFCPSCGGNTSPIIYICNKCGQRYISQLEVASGKRLILVLEPEPVPKETVK